MTDAVREWLRQRREDSKLAYDALMKFYPLELDDLDGEIWRDISGYEGHYQISNFGRLKSFYRKSPQIRKPALHGIGRLQFQLSKNGKRKYFRAYRLVAMAFIPNPDNKPEVNHIDGHKMNNHVSNLEWVTGKENVHHSVTTGLKKSGEDNYLAGMTNEQVAWCREVYNPRDKNFTATALAKKMGVTLQAMCHALSGKTYKQADGKIHNPRPHHHNSRVPDAIRQKIRAEYVPGKRGFGSHSLAKKYGVNNTTILRIINEK